jgi:DNA-binding IclR family transcriptional regulator
MSESQLPLDRAFAVLGAVAVSDRALSITELAQLCALPVPTVHRLAAQLEDRGLLRRAIGTKKLVVGPNLVRLGAAAVTAATRADEVHRLLEALATEVGEHCQLGVREGNEVVYSDTARAARATGLHFQAGGRAPLHCSSSGKLFLADMSAAELDQWLKDTPREAMTKKTLVSERALRAAIKSAREQNWAASNEEMAIGVVGCAVPVRLSDGRLIAGLGISVPSARTSFEKLPSFRPAMLRTARAIAGAIEAAAH